MEAQIGHDREEEVEDAGHLLSNCGWGCGKKGKAPVERLWLWLQGEKGGEALTHGNVPPQAAMVAAASCPSHAP